MRCRWIDFGCALIVLLSIVTDHQCFGDEVAIDDKTLDDFSPSEGLQPEKSIDTLSLPDDIVQPPDTSDEKTIKSISSDKIPEVIETQLQSDKEEVLLNSGEINPETDTVVHLPDTSEEQAITSTKIQNDKESGQNSAEVKQDSNFEHSFFDLDDLGADLPNVDVDSDGTLTEVKDENDVDENSADDLNTDNSDSSETARNHESRELSLSTVFQNSENNMDVNIDSDSTGTNFGKQGQLSRLYGTNSESDMDGGGNSNDDTTEDFSNGKEHSSCKNNDIVFVLDASDDVEIAEFQSIQQALVKMSDALLTQENHVRVGVVVYGSRITQTLPLSDNAAYIAESVKLISPSKGLNKPYLGILAGRGVLSGSPITNGTKILVLIASGLGQFAKPAIKQAEMAMVDGIYVMSIGYGDGTTFSDLEEVASGHSLSYMFESADNVFESTDKLSSKICRAPLYKQNEDASSSSDDSFKSDNSDEDESGSDLYNGKDESDSIDENGGKSTDDNSRGDSSSEIDSSTSNDSNDESNESSDKSDTDSSDSDQTDGHQTPEEMCANSKMVHGVGYKRHHTDCDKFIQCYYDESGKTRASVMQCPFGEFWDHQIASCVDSEETSCPNDPCKAPGLFSRPTSNGCGSYWTCKNGKSVIACCPESMSYQSQRGCVPDPKCSSPCPPDERPAYGKCDKRPLYGKPYLYKQWIVSGHWVEMLCAPGTLFVENDCGCTMRATYVSTLGVRARASETCRPELYLPFCQGLKDWSGKNTLVQNVEDRVLVTNGKAYFNGDASLFIPRFSGATYGVTIYIKLRYKPDFTEDDEVDDDQITDSGENNRNHVGIRWKPFFFQRKRRDTDDVTNDLKTALVAQPMSKQDDSQLPDKGVDIEKQLVLKQDDPQLLDNVVDIEKQLVLKQDDPQLLDNVVDIEKQLVLKQDDPQLLDKFVDMEKPSIDIPVDQDDNRPDIRMSPSNIEKADSPKNGNGGDMFTDSNVNIGVDNTKSTVVSSEENSQSSAVTQSESSENYFTHFETSVFDDENGENNYEQNSFVVDSTEKQDDKWFDIDKPEIKDENKGVMLPSSQDENNGEHYFRNWFTSGEDSSENSDESGVKKSVYSAKTSLGKAKEYASIEKDSSDVTSAMKSGENIHSFDMSEDENFNFNFNSNKPQIYGEYGSDENSFEDNEFYRWESENNEDIKQAWEDWTDDGHKSLMFDNGDGSQEDINRIIKNEKGNIIKINNINAADNDIDGNSDQNENIYFDDIVTNMDKKRTNDARVTAYNEYNRISNDINKILPEKVNRNVNGWMSIVSQNSGNTNDITDGTIVRQNSGKFNENTDNSLNIQTNIPNYNTKFEHSRDKMNILQSYFDYTNPDIMREKIQNSNFIKMDSNNILNEVQEIVQEKVSEISDEELSSSMALISNGNCDDDSTCLEDPSLSIGTKKDSTFYTVYASESKNTRIKLHKNDSDDEDGWRTALFTIDEGVFRVFDDHSTDFEPVAGPVETTFSGIYIGKGTGMTNFKGYIDEVYVYFCQPEDMEDFNHVDVPRDENAKTGDKCDYINKNVGQYYNRESSEESESMVSWWKR